MSEGIIMCIVFIPIVVFCVWFLVSLWPYRDFGILTYEKLESLKPKLEKDEQQVGLGKLTIEKLLEIKHLLDEVEKNRPKYYNEDGEECILLNLERK